MVWYGMDCMISANCKAYQDSEMNGKKFQRNRNKKTPTNGKCDEET